MVSYISLRFFKGVVFVQTSWHSTQDSSHASWSACSIRYKRVTSLNKASSETPECKRILGVCTHADMRRALRQLSPSRSHHAPLSHPKGSLSLPLFSTSKSLQALKTCSWHLDKSSSCSATARKCAAARCSSRRLAARA